MRLPHRAMRLPYRSTGAMHSTMKVKAKFFPGYTIFSTPKMEFQGKGTVHLHEIGLHAEGDMPRFTLPVLGRFYAPLFNARTSRTIPYSCITKYEYTGNWINLTVGKSLLILFLWCSMGLLSFALLNNPGADVGTLQIYILSFGGLIFLITILLFFKDRKRHRLHYRLPDGKIQRILFKQTKSTVAQINQFREILADYRSKASTVDTIAKP